MLRLIYTSVHSPDLMGSAFEQLRDHAAEKNRGLGISGLLLSNGKEFLQCLEGPTPQIIQTYRKILLDSRHSDIRLLVSEPAHELLFESWSMQGLSSKSKAVNAGDSPVYTLLDHRLHSPWRTLGVGASDLIYEYSRVKTELEKTGNKVLLDSLFETHSC